MAWLGKKKEPTFRDVDVKKAVATVTMVDDKIYTVTRKGYISLAGHPKWEEVYKGDDMLRRYFHAVDAFLIDDNGTPVPSAQVKCVSVDVQTSIIKVKE